jgi:hypothetical protein
LRTLDLGPVNWQTREGGQRWCADHDVLFTKSTTCPECKPVALDVIAPVTTDKELSLLESELRAEARYYRKLGRDLTVNVGETGYGLKAAEISLKYDRAYKELLSERKAREHDAWLVEENRKLQGDRH